MKEKSGLFLKEAASVFQSNKAARLCIRPYNPEVCREKYVAIRGQEKVQGGVSIWENSRQYSNTRQQPRLLFTLRYCDQLQ